MTDVRTPEEAGSTARPSPPLTLEVYYRYLRLYDKPNLPDDRKAEKEAGPVLEILPRARDKRCPAGGAWAASG